MKAFHCDHCGQLVFFENFKCLSCSQMLGYSPDLDEVIVLLPENDGTFTSPVAPRQNMRFRQCRNYLQTNTCNWVCRVEENQDYCASCRLTSLIPDLSDPAILPAWYKLEVAKRRLVYTLGKLHLPLISKQDDPVRGLTFHFLADPQDTQLPRVMTGHENGVITVNLAEADDAERENRKAQLHEPYRTLLGHLRHECGHYYWDLLVKNDPDTLANCRNIFGDDTINYEQSLNRYYQTGAPANWQDLSISAYATMHPWEDFAETWAHYLHIVDTLETAAICGISLKPLNRDDPSIKKVSDPINSDPSFASLMDCWLPLTYALNMLNRGLGVGDAYPFVLSTSTIQKLHFIHRLIAQQANGNNPAMANQK